MGAQHQVRRVVVLVEERPDGAALHGLDGVDRAEHLPSEGMPRPQRLVGERDHPVITLVLGEVQLLEDDLAFGLHVDGVERRLGEHLAQEVEPDRGRGSRHPRVERGVLVGGVGVQLAADGLDGLGELTAAVMIGALEQEVLEEVRGTREGV